MGCKMDGQWDEYYDQRITEKYGKEKGIKMGIKTTASNATQSTALEGIHSILKVGNLLEWDQPLSTQFRGIRQSLKRVLEENRARRPNP